MPRWPLPRFAPLLLLAAGCLDDHQSRLVPRGPIPPLPARASGGPPATEAAGRRVIASGRKLLEANPQLGVRPVFLTIGAPHPEVFHQGGRLQPYQVYVSEGLVTRCKTDDELSAVLALQLGRMVAEREAAAGLTGMADRPLTAERIGNDSDSTFGGPDGTRMMEAAHRDRARVAGGRPPSAETLAKQYLRRAGCDVGALAAVAPLLREAEDHDKLERHLRGAPAGQNRASHVLPRAQP